MEELCVESASLSSIACSPLPGYAGCEQLGARLRCPVSIDLFQVTSDRSCHDPGDEDRR